MFLKKKEDFMNNLVEDQSFFVKQIGAGTHYSPKKYKLFSLEIYFRISQIYISEKS